MKKLKILMVMSTLIVLGAGCGDDEQQTVVTTSSSVAATASPTTTLPLPTDGVDPDGVLLSALILVVGDPEAAVASGVVAPDEMDAAAEALETGTLHRWVDAATLKSGG